MKIPNTGKITLSILLVVLLCISFFFASKQYSFTDDKGMLQKQLTSKIAQVAGVWGSVKIVSGVISVMQTVQVNGSLPVVGGLGASFQPLGWADVMDNTLDKISNILLWTMGALAIQKMLLAISVWVSLKIIVPVCVILVIIAIWKKGNSGQLKRIIGGIIITCIGICSAVPLSLELSNVVETSILSNQINQTINEGKEYKEKIEKDGNDINDRSFLEQLKRIGSGITEFVGKTKQYIDGFIDNAINYIMCFIVTKIAIPIGTIFF